MGPTAGRINWAARTKIAHNTRLPDAALSHNSDKVIRSPKARSPQNILQSVTIEFNQHLGATSSASRVTRSIDCGGEKDRGVQRGQS